MHKYRYIHLSELHFRLIPQPPSFFMHHTLKQSVEFNSKSFVKLFVSYAKVCKISKQEESITLNNVS